MRLSVIAMCKGMRASGEERKQVEKKNECEQAENLVSLPILASPGGFFQFCIDEFHSQRHRHCQHRQWASVWERDNFQWNFIFRQKLKIGFNRKTANVINSVIFEMWCKLCRQPQIWWRMPYGHSSQLDCIHFHSHALNRNGKFRPQTNSFGNLTHNFVGYHCGSKWLSLKCSPRFDSIRFWCWRSSNDQQIEICAKFCCCYFCDFLLSVDFDHYSFLQSGWPWTILLRTCFCWSEMRRTKERKNEKNIYLWFVQSINQLIQSTKQPNSRTDRH